MNIPLAMPLVLGAALATITTLPHLPGPTPSPTASSSIKGLEPLPSQEMLLEARITALEKKVTQLQADNVAMKTHVHAYVTLRGPSRYVSVAALGSTSDPGNAYVALYDAQDGKFPSVGGIQTATGGPTSAPK